MSAANTASPATRAGVVVRLNGQRRFVSVHSVRRFVPPPVSSDVSGTGLSMALVDGQVLAIVAAGARGPALALCEVEGELVGVFGPVPEEVGFFAAQGSGVSWRGEYVSALDVTELVRAAARGGEESPEPEA